MKSIILILFIIVSLEARDIGWLHSFSDALEVAKQNHKIIYILITSSSCHWCEKFENTTLQNKMIKNRLNKDFVKVNLVKGFDDIPANLKVSPVPRHYFADANGHILYDSLGYRKVDTFMAFMGYAEDQIQKKEK